MSRNNAVRGTDRYNMQQGRGLPLALGGKATALLLLTSMHEDTAERLIPTFPMALSMATAVPLVLHPVLTVIAIRLIGFQIKTHVIPPVKDHRTGKTHGHLPVIFVEIKIGAGADVQIDAARRIIIISIPRFLRATPMRGSPRGRAAARRLDNHRRRRAASNRYSDADIGPRPVHRASR